MLPQKNKLTYEAFFASTETSDILDPKTTLMVQLAVSFAIGCYP